MAQEGSEASVASSSPAPNWWEIHANPISSWNAMNHRWQPHSNSSCDQDQDMSNISTTSFTNASSHSGLSMDSSSAELPSEPAENQLWSQVLFGVGNGGGDLQTNNHNVNDNENFLQVLTSKSLNTSDMFNPACDYLKKLDSSWELPDHHSPVNAFNSMTAPMIEPERLTNLSDLVSNWSIAPPNTTAPCNAVPHLPGSSSYTGMGYSPSYIPHHIKGESLHQNHVEPSSLLRPFAGGMAGYQVGLNNSMLGLGNKYCNGVPLDTSWSNNARSLSDLISFGGCLNKPAMEFRASARPSVKVPDLSSSSDSKKQGCHESSSSTKGSGRGSGTTTSDGKKKRSDDSSETLLKKSKHETSNSSSAAKTQPPKVKLTDRITALQQIVSPFGKTDTASVLLEAINYIRFLQEQVQLLSDPYLKSSANKEHNSWGGMERKDKAEAKVDLRSRGLCLVPVACTPQVYRDNTGPDYWTPAYRGCLYR